MKSLLNIISVFVFLFLTLSCNYSGNEKPKNWNILPENKEKIEVKETFEENNIENKTWSTISQNKENLKYNKEKTENNNKVDYEKVENGKITKDFWNGLVIKRFHKDKIRYDVLYYNNEEVFSDNVYWIIDDWKYSKDGKFLIIIKGGRVIVENNAIFDKSTKKIYETWRGTINQIEKWKSWIFVLLRSYFSQEIILIDSFWKKKSIFKSKVIKTTNGPEKIFDVDLHGFELMLNRKVKVFFSEWDKPYSSEKQEKIIDLNNL